jgi:RNA polymerase sigma-70 factor (ECF subfamily)
VGDTVELEQRIEGMLKAGDHAQAASHAIKGYGPQVRGYLAAVLRDEDDTADVFATFCEDLWRGLSTFRFECSFRTWAYKLAWHALARSTRDPHRRRSRRLATDEISALAAQTSSTTVIYLKRSESDRLARIRESLSPDEQTLLILRIDRGLSWSEIATVLAGASHAADEATLRKRFERLKNKIRERMAADRSKKS